MNDRRELTLKKKKPHIIVTAHFFKTEDGGRKSPTNNKWLGCPARIGEEYYDCVLLLFNTGSIKPGETVQVPVVFLSPEKALARLEVGSTFGLWHGRTIGECRVEEILDTWRDD